MLVLDPNKAFDLVCRLLTLKTSVVSLTNQNLIENLTTNRKKCIVSRWWELRIVHLFSVLEDIIDPAVLRPGRLDKVLFVGLPNIEDREDILRTLTKVRRSI